MKNFKLLVFSFALIFSALALNSSIASAQSVNYFVIENFDAQYDLTNKDPQGSLKIDETIDLNFSAQNRGILRAIPEEYKDQKLNLKINKVQRDGKSEPYITYSSNGNTVIR